MADSKTLFWLFFKLTGRVGRAAYVTGATFTLTVPVQAPTFFDFASLFVVPYMVALVFAGLGLWVYVLRWRTRAGRVYLIFCSMKRRKLSRKAS